MDVFVHSKVLVVDGEIVRIGSANLSNRSMRVDTECDITIEARGQERVEEAITRFRDQLLAEHLGQKPADVTAAIAERGGSLIQGIEALRTGERTLVPMELQVEAAMEADAIVQLAADPERPIDPEQFVNTFLFEDEAALKGRLRRRAAAMAVVIAALVLLWTLTPLREHVSPAEISHAITGLRASPIAPFLMMGVFAIGTLLMVPVNVLILATGLAFGPLLGVIYSVLGVLAGASAGYVTGRALGRETLRRISSSRINKLSQRLAKSGVLAIAAARIVPVAPFGVVNLVAGASYIHYKQFVAGTFIGNFPGIVLMTVFGPEALRAIIAGSPSRWLVVAGILVAVALVGGVFAWIRKRDAGPEPRYPGLRTSNAGAD